MEYKECDSFLSIIHPAMVWPWPPHSDAPDAVEWVFEFGRFDRERWRKNWNSLFDDYDLIHNNHKTVKIEVPGEDFPWKGRVCKIYTKMPNGDWKIIF